MALFRANAIHFGVDQLNGTFADHQNFIFWYLWYIYFGILLARLSFPMLYYMLGTLSLIIFIVALILLKCKKI